MSELSVINSPVAKIFFDDDFVSNVYPKKVSEQIDQAEPFLYQIRPEIRIIGDQIFDSDSSVLQFDLVFPRPSQVAILDAKKEIKAFYDEANRNVADIVLYPLEFVAYNLYLAFPGLPDFELLLGTRQDGPYGSTPIHIRKLITDAELIELITQHPEKVTVMFRPFYLFEATDTSSVFMQSTSSACAKAFEKIFGKNPDSTYLVNRRALQALQEAYKNEIHVEFRNIDPSNSLHEKAFDEIFDLIDKLRPIEPGELRNAQEIMFIYGEENFKIEIKPVEYHKMDTSFESRDKLYKEFEEFWDSLEEIANSSLDNESFYDKFMEHIIDDQKRHGKGSVDIFGKLGISQSLNFDSYHEKEYSQLTASERTAFQSLQQTIKDSGSKKEEFCRESYRNWTGENYVEGSVARPLAIFRVSQAMLSGSLTATAAIFEEIGEEAIIGPELQFPLSGQDSLTAGKRAADLLKNNRSALIQGACNRVWQTHNQEIIAAVLQHSNNPTHSQAQRGALIRFTNQFQAVLWGGMQQIILSCKSGRRLGIPRRMPQIGYCKPIWFRLAFTFIKNHDGLQGDEAAIADAYFNQMIDAWR